MGLYQENITRVPVPSNEKATRWLMRWNEPMDEDLLAVQDIQVSGPGLQSKSYLTYEDTSAIPSGVQPFSRGGIVRVMNFVFRSSRG